MRKAVSEIGHRVLEPLGQRRGARQRVGSIRKELHHRLGRLQIPLGVLREPPPRGVERGAVRDARQHVEQLAVRRRGEPDAVGGHDRHMKRSRQRGERRVVGFLVAEQMALQFDAHIAASEESDEAIQKAAHAVVPAVEQRRAAERHQPAGPAFELFEGQHAFTLWGAHLHARHEAAEISVTLLRLNENGQTPRRDRGFGLWDLGFRDRQLGADDGAQSRFPRRLVEPRRTVDAIGVQQRQRRVAERGGALDQRFRQRGALEETESGRAMEFDVHGKQQAAGGKRQAVNRQCPR